jgi:plastocyanin
MRMRRLGLTAAGTAALLFGAGLAGCFSDRSVAAVEDGECRLPGGSDVPGSTVVLIRGFAFQPGELRVAPGERVTWVNCDEVAHTSTADGGAWASPLLSPGDAFTQVFETAGEFAYHCEPHPFMTGLVIVE